MEEQITSIVAGFLSDGLYWINAILFTGSGPNEWLSAKLLLSFLGGLAAYWIRFKYFNSDDNLMLPLRKGFLYALLSAVGGLCIISPSTAANSFAAGLVGMTAIINLISSYHTDNENGQVHVNTEETVLSPEQVRKKFKEKG